MGLFSKKSDKNEQGIPKLPELPSLPQFPDMDEYSKEIHELPSFPSSGMGERFSRETIKNAISGDGDDDDEEPKITREELMPLPEFKNFPKTTPQKNYNKIANNISKPVSYGKTMEAEPVFIQIHKFEEALQIFKETKNKINEIESLLEETKNLKEKEDGELSKWSMEVQEMKRKIEKVDNDIFSKV